MELPNFISEHLSVIMSMKSFEVISEDIKERIQHLSYLMFLIGQQEDFQCFYSGYQTIQQYLKGSNVDVDHEDYHKMVEKLLSFEEKECFLEDENTELKHNYEEDFKDDDCHMSTTTIIQILKPLSKAKKNIRKQMEEKGFLREKKKYVKKKDKLKVEPPKYCHYCEYQSKSQLGLDKHMFLQHGQTLCSVCGANFESFSVYKAHIASHERKHDCDMCNGVFRSQRELEFHHLRDHKIVKAENEEMEQQRKSICTICAAKVFDLKNHMKSHEEQVLPLQYEFTPVRASGARVRGSDSTSTRFF